MSKFYVYVWTYALVPLGSCTFVVAGTWYFQINNWWLEYGGMLFVSLLSCLAFNHLIRSVVREAQQTTDRKWVTAQMRVPTTWKPPASLTDTTYVDRAGVCNHPDCPNYQEDRGDMTRSH